MPSKTVQRLLALWLLFLALTAILHHAVFFRPRCMLNPFGPDYDAATLRRWLAQDASPWLALLLSLLWARAARWWPGLWYWAGAFGLAFLPLSIWIWDLPFSGRAVCRHFHDKRVAVAGLALQTRHVYALCLGLLGWAAYRFRQRRA